MVFHGMLRNADEYRDGWAELADEYNFLVIAPEFSRENFPKSAGYNLGNLFETGSGDETDSDLIRKAEATWSFRVPDDLFDFLKEQGVTSSDGYTAFGHSAGSQFLHRKVGYAPDPELLVAVAANAGWYTYPTLQKEWPYGYKNTGLTQEALDRYVEFPLHLLLGEADVNPDDPGLRKTPEAMKQGLTRYERGHAFFEAGKQVAEVRGLDSNWKLSTVPGVAHEGQKMAPAAASILAKAIAKERSAKRGWLIVQLLGLVVMAGTVVMVVRNYQTHATLLLSGMALLGMVYLWASLSGSSVNGLGTSLTGWRGFDVFAVITDSLSSRVGKIGLIVMAAGGFARYMSKISASGALVQLAIGPLTKIRSPYLLLAVAYVFGQVLNVFIPSAAGLAMLLLVALYPTLTRLGLTPVSVAAVIGTTAALDLGPASGASNVAASICGLEPAVYFIRYQLPVAAAVVPTVAVLHFFWQRHLDRNGSAMPEVGPVHDAATELKTAPVVYAILPLLPLVLLIVFSPLVVKHVQLDVVTAMLIGLFAGLGFEAVRLRSLKEALKGIVWFFEGMGDIFAKVVTLLVAAEIFATGVKATGLIDSLVSLIHGGGCGSFAMILVLVLLMGFTAIVTGSGNAALFSFANLVPGISKTLGVENVTLMLPTQFAASLFRSMSPVAGVIIAVANTANVTPFAIVKRTAVPLLGGVLMTLLMQLFLF